MHITFDLDVTICLSLSYKDICLITHNFKNFIKINNAFTSNCAISHKPQEWFYN